MVKLSNTPWGKPNHIKELGAGVYSISCPSHGGIAVRSDLLSRIPQVWRDYARPWSHGFSWSEFGWFEEDCAWAAVALSFPELFSADDVAAAALTANGWLPKTDTAAA